MIQEGNMGEWKTVYEDEVEERWVTLKVYEGDDGDEDPVVRVTVVLIEDAAQDEGGQKPVQKTTRLHLNLTPLRTSRRS
jgi:hypothetical protein